LDAGTGHFVVGMTQKNSVAIFKFFWPSDLLLDMKPVLTDKRCSCDGEPFTPLRLKRGDLGQLAPRKKLLKSFRAFLEDFLRSLQAFGTEGFFIFGPLPADPKSIQ
jgi:hypothetical protein